MKVAASRVRSVDENSRERGRVCIPFESTVPTELTMLAERLQRPLLILFSKSLSVGFAVRIEEVLAALLPRRLEFGRCDVPVWPAFLANST